MTDNLKVLKLGDLGLATEVTGFLHEIVGCDLYHAPEIFTTKGFVLQCFWTLELFHCLLFVLHLIVSIDILMNLYCSEQSVSDLCTTVYIPNMTNSSGPISRNTIMTDSKVLISGDRKNKALFEKQLCYV